MRRFVIVPLASFLILFSCNNDDDINDPIEESENFSEASYPDLANFTKSSSSPEGIVYEVLPGPAALNPEMNPTPFSNNIQMTDGVYNFEVADLSTEDSENSDDEVKLVNIEFTTKDGTKFLIDEIRIIHKPEGAGDHTFFGGVGLNKQMHGNTGVGTNLMPRTLSYITLWGLTDLKNAETGEVVASNRIIHIMTGTNVRDKDLNLITGVEEDESDYDINNIHTHIIFPPEDTEGNADPIPGTDHGFIHMMYEDVVLDGAQRDWKLAYEVLPGPSAINPDMNPTPFSNKIGLGAGTYSLEVSDVSAQDSQNSQDEVDDFSLTYQRQNGETFQINNIQVIHKEEGSGDHSFFGGVGLDVPMHGDSGIGTGLMPKLISYITLWGTTDLLDGEGNILAENRLIHIMVSTRVRDENLNLLTSVAEDLSDKDPNKIETHIILPPEDLNGNMDPVPGTKHGFLHIMFESVSFDFNNSKIF